MDIIKDPRKIEETLTRAVNEVIDYTHLKKKLFSGKKLRIKLGIDPTSPNLHIGRSIPLLKLRGFQELGHKIIFIIGDFTGTVGDTSDKESERPALSDGQVKKNMKSYISQSGKIIDISKTEIRYNSEWLDSLNYKEICRQADIFSLAEFVARKNIRKRLDLGNRISLKELLYPLMQGYDSVAVKADVELGGTDQKFNLLAGRAMQTYYKQEPQDIMTNTLIEGLDGRKMSSSWGNVINFLDSPKDMFGKVMSMADRMITLYFECCTRVPIKRINEFGRQLKNSKRYNPRDIKMELAYEITKTYWGESDAKKGKDYFISVIQKKENPKKIKEIKVNFSSIVDVLVMSNLVESKSEARRLISQGGVSINGKRVKSLKETVRKGDIIKKGKRHFIKTV